MANGTDMTDTQVHFIAWLITAITDRCQTMDEVRQICEEIKKQSAY